MCRISGSAIVSALARPVSAGRAPAFSSFETSGLRTDLNELDLKGDGVTAPTWVTTDFCSFGGISRHWTSSSLGHTRPRQGSS